MLRLFLLVLLVGGVLVSATPADAQSCYGDSTYQTCTGRGGSLTCSGDVLMTTCRGSTSSGDSYRGTLWNDGFGSSTFNGTTDSGFTFRCRSTELSTSCH
jgi:hypothetical protein